MKINVRSLFLIRQVFLICKVTVYSTCNLLQESLHNLNCEVKSMIGDTNLFLGEEKCAEVEIMIAEVSERGKKMGWESILLMIRYGVEILKLEKFEAKIKIENISSIRLFEKIGFQEKSRSEVFREITYELEITDDALNWLRNQAPWKVEMYENL